MEFINLLECQISKRFLRTILLKDQDEMGIFFNNYKSLLLDEHWYIFFLATLEIDCVEKMKFLIKEYQITYLCPPKKYEFISPLDYAMLTGATKCSTFMLENSKLLILCNLSTALFCALRSDFEHGVKILLKNAKLNPNVFQYEPPPWQEYNWLKPPKQQPILKYCQSVKMCKTVIENSTYLMIWHQDFYKYFSNKFTHQATGEIIRCFYKRFGDLASIPTCIIRCFINLDEYEFARRTFDGGLNFQYKQNIISFRKWQIEEGEKKWRKKLLG